MEVLTHPMLDQLTKLGLTGMAFAELEASGEGTTLTHADWLGLLVDREVTHRRDKRLAARLRYAGCAIMPSSRTSITVSRAGLTARCSTSSPAASGSTRTTI